MTGKKRLFLAAVGPPGGYSLVTPPLGLLYIAAHLREHFALDIRIINQRAAGWTSQRLIKEIVAFEPHVVGLGCMTPSAHVLPEITQGIRDSLPEALMVLGGPHISALQTAAVAATAADIGVVGEGEMVMEQVMRAYIEGGAMDSIPGLIRREPDGAVVRNPGSVPLIENLDALPMPAYDLIDVPTYWRQPGMPTIPRRNYVSLFSSRGCPYNCMYCHNVFGRGFRGHSVERILEEIKCAKSRYGADEIEFVDDCFNLDRKRLMDYSQRLCSEIGPIKTAFPNAIRADILDDETADALTNAGMYYTALALESGTKRIQKLIGKRLDIEKFCNATALCNERRVFTNGFVMLGFPTETAREMEETIRVAADSKLHVASFFRVTPFPNTALFAYVKENAPEKLNEVHYNDMEYWRVKVNLADVEDAVLDRYLGRAYREFYFRPGRIVRILRDYPRPFLLPAYVGMFMKRVLRYA